MEGRYFFFQAKKSPILNPESVNSCLRLRKFKAVCSTSHHLEIPSDFVTGGEENKIKILRAASPQHTWLVYSVSRRETSNRDEAATDKAGWPTGRRPTGTRDPSCREVLAPESRAGGRGARGGRGGAAGRTARRWPAPSTSRRTRRAEGSARAAARPPPRHLFGRAPVPSAAPPRAAEPPDPQPSGASARPT